MEREAPFIFLIASCSLRFRKQVSWNVFGSQSLGRLGGVLGRIGSVLVHLGRVLGPLLDAFWTHFGFGTIFNGFWLRKVIPETLKIIDFSLVFQRFFDFRRFQHKYGF